MLLHPKVLKRQTNSSFCLVGPAILLMALFLSACRQQTTLMPAPPAPEIVDPWKEAALKVEQDRGQPMGRAAQVAIPDQVKHYSDTRRFLAIQIAESRKQHLRAPHDYSELINLIRRRELVEVPTLGNGYILYGVGLSATEDRFAHYDETSGDNVPLFSNDAELKQEYDLLKQSLEQEEATSQTLQTELRKTPRSDHDLRKKLQADLTASRRAIAEAQKRRDVLDAFYRSPAKRQLLDAEYQNIVGQAQLLSPASYSLDDGPSRKALKARLLSYLRPAALKVLESLAQSYQARFGRPLAVTSLVRTEQYQRQLRGSNPNATLVPTPPHTTGLAFDILYKFMAADEQSFLMGELARLRDEARIEVLRESRDHFHVFVFINGARPEERLIQAALDDVGPELKQSGQNKRRIPVSARARRNRS